MVSNIRSCPNALVDVCLSFFCIFFNERILVLLMRGRLGWLAGLQCSEGDLCSNTSSTGFAEYTLFKCQFCGVLSHFCNFTFPLSLTFICHLKLHWINAFLGRKTTFGI